MNDEIFESIQAALAEQMRIDPKEITLESDIADDLGADSLDAVEMVMALEDKYDIQIDSEDAQQLHTIADVVALVARLSDI